MIHAKEDMKDAAQLLEESRHGRRHGTPGGRIRASNSSKKRRRSFLFVDRTGKHLSHFLPGGGIGIGTDSLSFACLHFSLRKRVLIC